MKRNEKCDEIYWKNNNNDNERWFYYALIGKGTSLYHYCFYILPFSMSFLYVSYVVLLDSDLHDMVAKSFPNYGGFVCLFLFRLILLSIVSFLLWSSPLDRIADLLIATSRIRAMIHDVIPHIPELLTMIPDIIPLLPLVPAIAPHLSDIAPYVGDMLVHKKEFIPLLPKTKDRIYDLAPYVKYLAPSFHKFDQRHVEKIKICIDPFLEKFDIIAPHIHHAEPYMAEIVLLGDKIMPYAEMMLEHVDDLVANADWLVEFADIEGVDVLFPLFPEFIPYIDVFAPVARRLKEHFPAALPYLPILIKHIDNVGDVLPNLAEHIGPVLYNFAFAIPLASAVGLLDNKTLISFGPFFAKQLPPAPSNKVVVYNNNYDSAKKISPIKKVTIPYATTRKVTLGNGVMDMTVFYQVHINRQYHGEYRYSDFRNLHLALKKEFGNDFRKRFGIEKVRFPKRTMTYVSSGTQQERRGELERYLYGILIQVPEIANSELVQKWLQHSAHLQQQQIQS